MVSEPIVVRQATVDDIPFMLGMMEEAYSASPTFLAHVTRADIERFEEQVWQKWRESPGPAFVAVDGAGRPLGAIRCEPYEAERVQAWGIGIGVEADARGQGIGQRLIEHAIAAARTANVPTLSLMVDPTNARAIALYRRTGFVVVRELEGAIAMRLDLGEPTS